MADNLTIVAAARLEWFKTLSDDDKAKVQASRAAWKAEETKAELM